MSSRVPIVSPEDLERITLTRTGFGFIIKAFHTPRNADVVLKLLTCKNATDRDLKALLEDVAGIRHVHCERLMPPIGIYQFQGLLGVVTEWMHNGSLHSLIHEHELYPDLPLPLCVRILTDVAEGLSHLHSLEPPILHHSLKPSNVLLDLDYRAKISDYSLPTWRRQQLRSVLQNCDNRSCWDLLYLSPEIVQGGSFSREGDIYSFGMMCWETLSRQKPLEGKKTLLEAVTGICRGMRPGVEPAFISSGLPHRNKLLQMVALCWHQEPHYRPRAADCMVLLQDVLGMFRKETISDAIYNLIHAKDCATDAAKSPASHGLEIDLRNLEAVSPQYKTRSIKKTTLEGQSLPGIHLESDTNGQEKEAKQTLFASDTPPNTALEKDPSLVPVSCCSATLELSSAGPPACGSRGFGPHHSLPTLLTSDLSEKVTFPLRRKSEGWQQPLPVPGADRSPSHSNFPYAWPGCPFPDPCYKGNCCAILACGRESILSFMTEGRLNHILDVLRSQQILSRMDYETITSFPTVTSRSRALLDTCLGLGEKAAQTVVAILSASKCSPLARGLWTKTVN
ncbi:PREDICTED: receptor-interacting serine/threonine-protein kinase 2-like [Gekko japonicus]|uniref:Receptor-interacting serine/threonine-protein kinase 2-like n=1 Tax=Gekko japonicus TaxID=146911 RepID=A0ABM1LGX0_GEKJA|nr:PREDICTED: receptor-interacting serine/threonine-protein kinase 2-like [Gekko japonicus]